MGFYALVWAGIFGVILTQCSTTAPLLDFPDNTYKHPESLGESSTFHLVQDWIEKEDFHPEACPSPSLENIPSHPHQWQTALKNFQDSQKNSNLKDSWWHRCFYGAWVLWDKQYKEFEFSSSEEKEIFFLSYMSGLWIWAQALAEKTKDSYYLIFFQDRYIFWNQKFLGRILDSQFKNP